MTASLTPPKTTSPLHQIELSPHKADMAAHLSALFPPAFVHPYQDSWIEIAWSDPADGQLNRARKFSAFDLIPVIDFAERKNAAGYNVYVGAALRRGRMPAKGRASDDNFQAASFAWVEFDGAGDDARIAAILKEKQLTPALVVTTGNVPHLRAHLYFPVDDGADREKLVAALKALKTLLKSDNVDNAGRVMRLAGTINYPTPDKAGRGYVPELVTLRKQEARTYRAQALTTLGAGETNHFLIYAERFGRGHSDDALVAVLESVGGIDKWHEPMLAATGIMIGRGYSDFQIKLICAPYCDGGFNDPDLPPMIDEARRKWDMPEAHNVKPAGPLIVSSAAFLDGFIPPDYLFDGILQRHFIYSMTALTGSGKTAIALMLAVHVALGQPIGDRFLEQGRVLYFAGENPDDIRMRWLASAEKFGFDPATIDVHFLPGAVTISKLADRIREEVEAIGPVALVIIDTSAAYFEGDDENANVPMGNHARLLRTLVTLPGEPCVLVACHPVKNAGAENLLPRGGGAFLNEMDGNLTCALNEAVVRVHTQGKFRGPEFAPLYFKLHTATAETLKDSRGRQIPSVVAMPLSEIEQQQAEAGSRNNEDELLILMADGHTRSLAEIATALHWLTKDHKPNKVKVQRAADRLKASKLAETSRRGLVLTARGQKEANQIGAVRTPQTDTGRDRTPKF
jgi:hypothetical protein